MIDDHALMPQLGAHASPAVEFELTADRDDRSVVVRSDRLFVKRGAGKPHQPAGAVSSFALRKTEVHHPVARDILAKLQGLHRLAREATPVQLLAFAIERLNLRVVIAARHGRRNARALANLDAVIEFARPYDVADPAYFCAGPSARLGR